MNNIEENKPSEYINIKKSITKCYIKLKGASSNVNLSPFSKELDSVRGNLINYVSTIRR